MAVKDWLVKTLVMVVTVKMALMDVMDELASTDVMD